MSNAMLIEMAQSFLCLIVVITFHEAAHAYVANQRGDDTAKHLGRITLNPIAHMELIGTVILPLLAMGLSAAGSVLGGFIIGWGKPVPINPSRLKDRMLDGMWIALAGPAMNVVLAVFVLGLCKLLLLAGIVAPAEVLLKLAYISLALCFLNLIPVPPLDGSHVLRYLTRMPDQTFHRFAQFGFIILIVLVNIPAVRETLVAVTAGSFRLICRSVGLPY